MDSIGYVRTSRDARDRESLKVQRREIRRFCDYRKRKLVAILEDNAYSGTDRKRPAFGEALKMLKEGKAQELVVYNLDRFSRDIGFAVETMKRIKEWGCSIASTMENLDFSTIHGEMMFNMFILFGEYNLRLQRQKTIDAKVVALSSGRLTQGKPKYGYQRGKNKKIVTNPEQKVTIKKIYRWFTSGRKNETQIAHISGLSQSTVHRILSEEIYHTGKYRLSFGGETTLVDVERFVKRGDFLRAQEQMKANYYPRRKTDRFKLRGKIYCPICSKNIHTRNQPPYFYYQHRCEDGRHAIDSKLVDDAVFELLTSKLRDKQFVAHEVARSLHKKSVSISDIEFKMRDQKETIKRIDREMDKLVRLMRDAEGPAQRAYQRELAKMGKEIESRQKTIKSLEDDSAESQRLTSQLSKIDEKVVVWDLLGPKSVSYDHRDRKIEIKAPIDFGTSYIDIQAS